MGLAHTIPPDTQAHWKHPYFIIQTHFSQGRLVKDGVQAITTELEKGTAEEVGAAGDLPWCGQLHPGVCGGGPARPQAPEGRLDPPRVTDAQGGGSIPAALLFCCGSPWRIVCNRFIW